jgi:sugar transferase (PEP-CTERM/EpsH1 system associated)
MKIMVVLSRVPYPLEKGDKLRAFNQIKQLSKKHQIYLFALNDTVLEDKSVEELKKYCRGISIIKFSKFTIFFNLIRALFNGKPLQVGYFYFNKAQKKLDKLIEKHKPDHICQLIRTSEYVKKYPNIPKTLDYMDIFSKGMERRKKLEPFYLKPFLAMEYRRLLRYENKVFSWFNNKTIISEQDKNFIPHPNKQEIKVITNGVDTDFFKPMPHKKKEFELLFNGNMNYPPNIESVEYLVENIMPYVWNKLPNTRLLISGATPNQRVLDLASNKVVVSGFVEDIRENFAKSKVLVAPMQISIGLQNKLLEGMAMQIPCITSSLANNALGAKHNDQIMVADTAEQFAICIIELLSNETKAKQIAMNGYQFVIKNFNWQSTTAQLEQLFLKK